MTKILDLVPSWAWALLVAALVALQLITHGQLSTARLDAQTQKTTLAQERGEHQKALADETQKTLDAERDLRLVLDKQERTDRENKQTSAGYEAQLRDLRAAGNGRLRDPFAKPASCPAGASGSAAAGAAAGPADGADAGGLLSEELSRFLQLQEKQADAINDAYISCRADAFAVRARLQLMQTPAP